MGGYRFQPTHRHMFDDRLNALMEKPDYSVLDDDGLRDVFRAIQIEQMTNDGFNGRSRAWERIWEREHAHLRRLDRRVRGEMAARGITPSHDSADWWERYRIEHREDWPSGLRRQS